MGKLSSILTYAGLLCLGLYLFTPPSARAVTAFNFSVFDGGYIINDTNYCGRTTTKIHLGHSLSTIPTSSVTFYSTRTGYSICSDSYTLAGYSGSDYTGLVSSVTFDFEPNDYNSTSTSMATATASFDSNLFYEIDLNGCDLYNPVSIGEGTAGSCTCYDGEAPYCYGGTFSGLPYLTAIASSSEYLYFITPENGTDTTPFDTWVIGFGGFASSTNYDGTLRIYYGSAGSSTSWVDQTYFTNYGIESGEIEVPRIATNLWNPGDPIPREWAAWAQLVPDETSTAPIDTGLTIYFNIYPIGVTSSSPPTTSNCNFTSSSFLGDPVGNIQQGICQAFVYLFIPGPAQQADLSSHFTNIRSAVAPKPPFGYFFGLLSAFSAINSGSSTISVWTAELVNAFSVILDPIDALAASVIGILFALWLLHKIGIIQL